MKSLPKLALASLLIPVSAVTLAADADIYREFARHRAQALGAGQAADYLASTFPAHMLTEPGSPYSDLVEAPEFTQAAWWAPFVDSLDVDGIDATGRVLGALQRQAGVTKARPGKEVALTAETTRPFRYREVAANAIKAGIDPDIFWKAADMQSDIAVAAKHAVALQVLRSRMEELKASVAATRGSGAEPDATDYASRGIDPMLLEAYMQTPGPSWLREEHTRALATLLEQEIAHVTGRIERGAEQLPATYRVARVAAAYTDSRGYARSTGYCESDDVAPSERELQRNGAVDDSRPLCFIGATDRSVQAWFSQKAQPDVSLILRPR